MKEHTAAEKRFFANATVIGALRVIFGRLSEANVPLSPLSEIAQTSSGGTPDRNNSSYYGGSIPWMKSGELTDGEVTKIEETITELGLANSSAKVLPVGTLLIALYGATVGKTGILGVEAASNQAVCAVLPRTQNVCGRYLFWFLRRKREEFLQMSFGGAQPNISQKILRDTLVPLPSLSVQETIASFLDAVEKRLRDQSIPLPELPAPLSEQRRVVARIEELSAQIREARTLRHQAAQEADALFTTETTRRFNALLTCPQHPISSLGMNDENPIQIGPFGAQLHKTEFVDEGVPVLNVGNVWPQGLRLDNLDHVSSEKADELRRYAIQSGDLLFARSGATLGKVCLVPPSCDGWLMTGHLFRVRFDPGRVLNKFAFIAFRASLQIQEQVFGQVRGATRPGFNTTLLSKVLLPLPPLSEQRRIVAELDALQAEVDALKRLQAETSAELDALLPAILDRAFKGEL